MELQITEAAAQQQNSGHANANKQSRLLLFDAFVLALELEP